jgi:hypothetical protein
VTAGLHAFPISPHQAAAAAAKRRYIKVIINLPIAYQPRAIKTFDAKQNHTVKKKHKAG